MNALYQNRIILIRFALDRTNPNARTVSCGRTGSLRRKTMTDYIDREQAIRFAGYSAGLMYKRGYLDEYYALEKFMGTLGRIPAADVKPVVHGKWKVTGTFKVVDYNYTVVEQRCSACGHCSIRFKNKAESNYCPKCGATMDEEEPHDR